MLTATDAFHKAHPNAHVAWMLVENLTNPSHAEALESCKRDLENHLRATFAAPDAIATDPRIKAYRDYYKAFGKSYHVEMQLASIVHKNKSIPTVAGLVEAMFMAELKNRLLTAGHDADTLADPLRLDVAKSDEAYTLLGGKQATTKENDMVIRDANGILSSILSGPDARTPLTPQTTRALFTIYAPPGITPEMTAAHLADLFSFIRLAAPTAQITAQGIAKEIVP